MAPTKQVTAIYKDYNKELLISSFLRFGIAFVFLYASISTFLNPSDWIGFFPDYLVYFLSKQTLLFIFSGFELLLGLAILGNYRIFLTSVLSTITLFLITIFNVQSLDIVFRDFAIFVMSLSLNIMSYRK